MFMFLSFCVTAFFVVLFTKLALKVNLVDQPGGRKTHDCAVPLVGGIAIFSTFILLSIFFTPFVDHWMSFAGLAILLCMGVVDDAVEVNAKLKFAVHFLVSGLLVYDGTTLNSMGNLFGMGNVDFGMFAPIFTALCVVYLINAINMIDGIDGLSGGIGFVVMTFLFSATLMKGVVPSLELQCMIGALVAFLMFNYRHPWRERASIFMGDAGTMALGFVMAWLAIDLSQPDATEYGAIFEPISIAWLLALPIWDAFGMLTARIRNGKHPFEPDRNHFHHHFLKAGYKPEEATPIIMLYCMLLGSIGVFGPSLGIPTVVLTLLWIVMWGVHAQLSYKPHRLIKVLASFRQKF
jgi:UDP-GlcNAc:undecaprenyl-phosphate GlcNAc-1-phosphate transferase